AEAESRGSVPDQELLYLGVVIVASAGRARVRREIGKLAAARSLQHLDEGAANVGVRVERITRSLGRQGGDEGRIESAGEARSNLADCATRAGDGKGLDELRQLADGRVMN